MLPFLIISCGTGQKSYTKAGKALPQIEVPSTCKLFIEPGQRSAMKGECSGPYFLAKPKFLFLGKALVIDLSSVQGLPGQKVKKHVTVLYGEEISLEDKKHAEAIFKSWSASKEDGHEIYFYLDYWGGKKSELIVGELKELVQRIRKEFPLEKIPATRQAAIHVELDS